MRFQAQVAVVTGASSGIGRAAALAFAREGAKVAIVDKDEEKGNEVVQQMEKEGWEALFVKTNVAVEAEVQAMVDLIYKHWGRLDILVNNAGIYYQADVVETPYEVWNDILGVNLTGAFLCIKYAVPAMIQGDSGVVVNVASEAGLVGIKRQVAYNVSKAGMISLTWSCAIDLAARGVRVNCVCPGTTETPLVREAVNRAPDPAAARRALEEVRPLNRLGTPEEIASAILYMASTDGGYATGAVLSIDGGYTAQ